MPATRAGRALAQDAADYGICDGYWCIVGYGYLSLILRTVIPSAESFNLFTIFSQTRLVYPQFFLPVFFFFFITITTLPMINALDYVASDIIYYP